MHGKRPIYLSLPRNKSLFLCHIIRKYVESCSQKVAQKLVSIFSSFGRQLQKWPFLSPYMNTQEPYNGFQFNTCQFHEKEKRGQHQTNNKIHLEMTLTNKNYIHE
jgi:hypothetical protein